MNQQPKMRVYYNSACPVCKAGIEREMDKVNGDEIQWGDIHARNELVSEINAQLEFVRERLHVVDKNGKLHVGLDGFLIIWRNSPTEKWKAALLGFPGIKLIGQVAYNLFAAALYRWNKSQRHWVN